ncbi:MAG TPA: hypothetical protein VL832_20950 [Puia sp.]|nr:hypothetical protein [Puia sp.]
MKTSDLKRILIITPHFPPSNLAAVHRSRLFAQHLPSFGWEPLILTVDEKYYEETLDPNLSRLLPEGLQIEKVAAFGVTRPRLIGDIGLRGFFQLYRRARQLIKERKIDFLYIPIPSFYGSLLGRRLHASTGIKYGIDYIDPWVHRFPGSDKIFSRHWFSSKLSGLLEPIAIKKASLITGVAEGYYKGVLERNPHLQQSCVFGAMPYGGERSDHEKVAELGLTPYLFEKKPGKIQLLYAGAMLPKAYAPLEGILKAIHKDPAAFRQLEIHFIGTGKTPDDALGYNIRPLAEKYGLWNSVIFEYPRRIPYLDVLVHLEAVSGVFILGSTEPHYTPSKVYQGVLSGKPILAVLHTESTAVDVIRTAVTGLVLAFGGEPEIHRIENEFMAVFKKYTDFLENFNPQQVNMAAFEQYSAKNITGKLAELLEKCIEK